MGGSLSGLLRNCLTARRLFLHIRLWTEARRGKAGQPLCTRPQEVTVRWNLPPRDRWRWTQRARGQAGCPAPPAPSRLFQPHRLNQRLHPVPLGGPAWGGQAQVACRGQGTREGGRKAARLRAAGRSWQEGGPETAQESPPPGGQVTARGGQEGLGHSHCRSGRSGGSSLPARRRPAGCLEDC